jgi:hypothetical protein
MPACERAVNSVLWQIPLLPIWRVGSTYIGFGNIYRVFSPAPSLSTAKNGNQPAPNPGTQPDWFSRPIWWPRKDSGEKCPLTLIWLFRRAPSVRASQPVATFACWYLPKPCTIAGRSSQHMIPPTVLKPKMHTANSSPGWQILGPYGRSGTSSPPRVTRSQDDCGGGPTRATIGEQLLRRPRPALLLELVPGGGVEPPRC